MGSKRKKVRRKMIRKIVGILMKKRKKGGSICPIKRRRSIWKTSIAIHQ